MNFKSKMPIKDQLNMMNEIEHHTFEPKLLIAPTLLEHNNRKNFDIISQDISIKQRTVGEVPANALKYLGIKYAIVGHIERRTMLKERYDVINDRLTNALDNNIIPIICLGIGSTPKRAVKEFNRIVGNIDLSNKSVIVAWESLKSSKAKHMMYTKQDAVDMFHQLRSRLNKYSNIHYKLVIGGHVGPKEARLSKDIDIDGVLIGDRFKHFPKLNAVLQQLS